MIKNNWSTTESLPQPGVELLAKVRGFGVCKMMRISAKETDIKCSFDPYFFKKKHDFTWCQVDSDFVCSEKLIEGWQHINSAKPNIK